MYSSTEHYVPARGNDFVLQRFIKQGCIKPKTFRIFAALNQKINL